MEQNTKNALAFWFKGYKVETYLTDYKGIKRLWPT